MLLQIFAGADDFLAAITRCLNQLQAARPLKLTDPLLRDERMPDSIWQASDWLQLIAPIAIFLRQAVIRFRASAVREAMQQAVAATLGAFNAWSAESSTQGLPQALLR